MAFPLWLTKAQYARRHNRTSAAVSTWIHRGQLTSPALRVDGMINVALADAQLQLTVDPMMSAARGAQPIEESVEVTIPPVAATAQSAQAQLINARAAEAMIKAERSRRELNAQAGIYTLTEEMRREYGRGIMEHLQSVEQSLPGLAQRLGLDRDGLLELRKWWRDQRKVTAERNRVQIENYPEFIADPAA